MKKIKVLKFNKPHLKKTGILFLILFISFINNHTSGQTVTLASSNPAIPAANICQSALKVPIYQFTLISSATTNLTNLTFTTNTGYTASDIVRFQLYSSTTNNLAGAAQVGINLTTALGPGSHSFAAFSRSISTTLRYFWITADINATAIGSNFITVPALITGNLTISAGTLAGTAFIGGPQTIIASPGAVTVNGGGTFCGNSTLTASGGTGGIIYWQNTTSNGTITSVPSTSQVVTSSGTYYFRASNLGCWGAQGSATVTINPLPAVTLGLNPSVCAGNTSVNLSYSGATGNPNQYSIDYDAAANAQGFFDIVNASLPVSPITLNVPAGAIASTYNFYLTFRTSTTGCISSAYPKTITVIPNPSAPGAISGLTTVAPLSTGLVYSISPVQGATSYQWTIPTGWTITAGTSTASITVTSGNVGQDGNITVKASNSCFTTSASSMTVSIVPPHNNCNQCHLNHNSYGTALAIINGNANLCISCHNLAGTAQRKPFNNAMKAVPGISGTSHTWDAAAVNYKYGANLPADSGMLLRMDGGKILCSTCHNQHSETFSPFLRISNGGDAMCKQCHSVRNVGRYIDNPAVNLGSHPVGLTYNGSDARFYPTPISPVQTSNSKVECSSCHKTHYATSNDGYTLRMNYTDDLCKSCHIWKAARRNLDHEGMNCITCHTSHKAGLTNIMLVRDTITTPNSGQKVVLFTSNALASNYADAANPFNGVCEACHTQTDHYKNTTGGTSDARHVPATQKCTSCHPHDDAFYAQTNCLDCHKNITDKPGIGPLGGRRQIVDANGNGSGAGGDFKRTSHHVSGTVPNVNDCILCHYMGDHMRGTVKLMDPDLGYLNIISYDPLSKSTIESFCIKCHDNDGAGGDLTPFSDNVIVPIIDGTIWGNSAHKSKPYTCMDCHDNGHGSNKHKLLAPFNKTADATADPLDDEEEFCLNCHKAGGAASSDVQTEFGLTHTHQVNEVAQYTVNSGIECISCHNTHQNTNAYPLSDPDNTDLLMTQTSNRTRDFCLRCHDGTPPTGISFPATFQGSGYNKSAYVNSRHDQVINNGEQNFVAAAGEDCLACHDRHGTNGSGETTKTGLYTMLKGNFDKSGNATSNACNPWSNADYGLCFTCHQTTLVSSNNAFGSYHNLHVNSQGTPCIICHDVHSSYDAGEKGLIDFGYGTTALSGTDVAFVAAPNNTLSTMFVESTGSCYMSCHRTGGFASCSSYGHGHNPETYSSSDLAYPWTYSWPY